MRPRRCARTRRAARARRPRAARAPGSASAGATSRCTAGAWRRCGRAPRPCLSRWTGLFLRLLDRAGMRAVLLPASSCAPGCALTAARSSSRASLNSLLGPLTEPLTACARLQVQEAQSSAAALEALEAELSVDDTLLYRSLAERLLAGGAELARPASGSGKALPAAPSGSARGPGGDASEAAGASGAEHAAAHTDAAAGSRGGQPDAAREAPAEASGCAARLQNTLNAESGSAGPDLLSTCARACAMLAHESSVLVRCR